MDVTAKYELIGLMAYPIRHSLSPEMQNKALEKAGLPFTYMAFEVDNDSFPGAIEGLKALKMRGTGVSMPNKQLACEYVDELTPAAKLVGAINTIVNDDGYLRGYNTDGTGHIRAIKESGFDIKGKTMVLLGAGGASTAIGAQGAIEGLKEIKLFNRRISSSIKPSPSRSGLTKTPIVSSRLPISPISKPLLKPWLPPTF